MKKIILDNIKIIVAAIAAFAVIILAAVILSLAFGGGTVRSLTVNDIHGNVVIIRGNKQFYANKKTVLQSGDIVNTDESSSVRICLDFDKYIVIEPESSVYVYYTQLSDKGEVSVNIAAGAVICQLNKPLTKKETFYVKTPNTAVSVRGTVFRTEFSLEEKYMGYSDVMLTHVQNFDGSVMLQLYDINGEKTDNPQLLTEKTSAELVSCKEFAQYGYINYDTDMYALDEITAKELIRISGERPIAYSLEELNIALKAIRRRISDQSTAATTSSVSETTETEAPETTTSATVTPPAETAVTAGTAITEPEVTEETTTTTYGTVPTTIKTHVYTTYPGPKWWEMPNQNPYDDDYIDDIDSENGVYPDGGEENTVTAVP